jgi:hypothetical protein
MYVQYNGVRFEILRVTDYVDVEVMTPDLTTYLWNSIDIRCECILNPGATTVSNFGPSNQVGSVLIGAAGPAQDGLSSIVPSKGSAPQSPVQTYKSLADRLKQPRQKLIVWMDSKDMPSPEEIILESPLPGYFTDAQFGPVCTVHKLDGMHGNASLWMDVQFHTDIRRCPQGSQGSIYGSGAFIANRWTFSVHHDPETYCAIHVIEGQADFRMDVLSKFQVTPDQLRGLFIFPVPWGFQREPPTVSYLPGGSSVAYRIVDREKILNVVRGQVYGAIHIDVVESRKMESPWG